MVCKSLFLDPTIYAEGKDMKYSIASKDRRNFDIILNDNTVGKSAQKDNDRRFALRYRN